MNLFPEVTLSELRANLARDREKFQSSTDALRQTARERTRPVRFLVEHSGAIAGTIASLFALYEVGTAALPAAAAGRAAKGTWGVARRLARIGIGLVMKAATPAAATVIQKLWTYATDRKSADSNNGFSA